MKTARKESVWKPLVSGGPDTGMAGCVDLEGLVKREIFQRKLEGCDTEGLDSKLASMNKNEETLAAFYKLLEALPADPQLRADEPDELNEIQALRPAKQGIYPLKASDDVLSDKFYGAWLGRSVGCALGKPIEQGCYMGGQDGRPGWENVKLWFEGADAWPISGYTPGHSRAEHEYNLTISSGSINSTRERIAFMETDDDIRYTVLGLVLLEQKGLDWTSFDVGKLWHERLPYTSVCTAETQAYLNFALVTNHWEYAQPADWAEKVKWVRTYRNPCRELIGAQIRVDAYAYAAAGNPGLAAELCWRDASFSHVRNGIYGAMFFGAAIACAFALDDPEKIIGAGLNEIPKNCRFVRDIRTAVSIAKEAKEPAELASRLHSAFNYYGRLHTNSNAALCAASIVFARGDFERAITTAVLGWDTDCNGATVGSLMGAMLGASAIPEKWKAPLHDTLYSEIPDFHPIAISECARRSLQTYRKITQTTAR